MNIGAIAQLAIDMAEWVGNDERPKPMETKYGKMRASPHREKHDAWERHLRVVSVVTSNLPIKGDWMGDWPPDSARAKANSKRQVSTCTCA